MKKLVLLGGGHAHVEVLRDLALQPEPGVEVTLVSPDPHLIYTGMVPGVIAGHYSLADCGIDLAALAARAQAAWLPTRATLVSPARREVTCGDGTVVPYDVLSVDVGAVPATAGTKGAERHAMTVRPLRKLIKGWVHVLDRALRGDVTAITVVGGGAAGVELALAMDYRLRREMRGRPVPHVRVITATPVPVPDLNASARARLRRRLARRNIGLHLSSTVSEVGERFVRLQSGMEFASDATFWVTGPGAQEWIRQSGFATDDRGALLTNDFLQSVTFRDVFGAGDCATQENRRLPKAGVFAVRAAPKLARNLRAALRGAPLEKHVTSPRFLALVSTGPKHAVGAWGALAFQGWWAWLWKNHIDRKFVARYAPPKAAKTP
jgi:selenide,water dikinase